MNNKGLWPANSESLIHDCTGEEIVIPGEPVVGGEGWSGQTHHLGVTRAEAGFLPDDTQGGDNSFTACAGPAHHARRTIVRLVAHSHTGSFGQGEGLLQLSSHPDFDIVIATRMDRRNTETLSHGICVEVVVPGIPVLSGELFQG